MSNSILREAVSVLIREAFITMDYLRVEKVKAKGHLKQRISNRLDGLEISIKKAEEILNSAGR
jgi:hypothetical protein